ncbi:MAG: GNAT family N-acetyltransferase, partial [Lachnospiraceae bacterium]|nr:GNAT family N-acetyltransferase [Lachnospiraceae bacterium]
MNIDAPHQTQLPALRTLWQEAFGDTDAFLDAFFSTAFRTDHCCCVTLGNQVVAALYWLDCQYNNQQIAYLYAVATTKAFRRQGICHKLIETTHRQLTSQGYKGALLVPATEELFHFYERMGYQTCSRVREFRCVGMNQNLSLHRINKTEYATLRRRLLPSGGVIQENETLDFLQTQTLFYTGPGFVFAAGTENNTLCVTELLGDETVAPGIVYALGYSEGHFRTPGNDMPFAMYCPLGESKLPPPTYFGLALD